MQEDPAPTLQEFHIFPNLPIEIRLKIWEEAILLYPRIVEINTWSDDGEEDNEDDDEDDNEGISDGSQAENSEDEAEVSDESAELGKGISDLNLDVDPNSDNEKDEDHEGDGVDKDDQDSENVKDKNNESRESPPATPYTHYKPKPFSFYTPTPPHPLLSVNHESRSLTLSQTLTPPLLIPQLQYTPLEISFLPSIDTLYFPAPHFEEDISSFENFIPLEMRAGIKKIALEILIWQRGSWGSAWEEGMVNGQMQISEWAGLEELVLVRRKPDRTGCGCAHEFGEERGRVGFRDYVPREGNGTLVEHVRSVFEWVRRRDKGWRVPRVRFVHLMRDGEDI